MLHHARIGVQGRERLAIPGTPLPQQQARRRERREGHVTPRRRAAGPARCAPSRRPRPPAPGRRPAACARISFSIFMASTITSTCPASTASPSPTSTRRTVPCIGLVTRSPPGAPRTRARPPLGAAAALGGEQLVGRQRDRHLVARPVHLDRVVPLLGGRERRLGGIGGREGVGELALDQPCAGLAGDERRVLQDHAVQRDQRRHALDHELVERAQHAQACALAVAVPDAQLGDQRVVQADDLVALLDARLDAHARARRRAEAGHAARRRPEARAGVLGVDAALEGVAAQLHVALRERQLRAGGDLDLGAHQVEARDELGDRVLDLDARVHLEEEELAVTVEQALDGARADVADGACGIDRHRPHAGPELGRDRGRGRLLEHLLVAALERAVALAEVDRRAVGVCEDLDLDVARILHVLLDVDRCVGEVGLALAPRRRERALGLVGRCDHLHAAAATAGRGLDRDRPAVLVTERDHRRGVADLLGRARHDRHAGGGHALPRPDLGAHGLDRRGRRTDPDDPGGLAGTGEPRVLGQEAVARVDRLRPARLRGRDDPLDVQVALGRRTRPEQPRLVGAAHVQRPAIGLRVHRNGADAELAEGAEDANGDLPAIRDEHLAEGRGHGRGSLVPCPRGSAR